MKITAHMVIRNEDCWVWYAIQSVLPYVDKILVCINGSSDHTSEIVKAINSSKIEINEIAEVDRNKLVDIRNGQLKETKTDWFLILDGDEVWPESQIKKLIQDAEKSPANTLALVNKVRLSIGDVYHYLPESTGRYKLMGKMGNFNIRLIKKTADLKIVGEYPWESYDNRDGPISKQDNNLVFADSWYLHTSFLKRSSQDNSKRSGSFGRSKIWQKGIEMNKSELPEVLFQKSLPSTHNPLQKRGLLYEFVANITTPAVAFKQKIK